MLKVDFKMRQRVLLHWVRKSSDCHSRLGIPSGIDSPPEKPYISLER